MKFLRTTKPNCFSLLVTACLLKFCFAAHAQTIWNAGSATTNVWSEPLNWNTTVAPTSADAVVFNNAAAPATTNVQGAVNSVMDFDMEVLSASWTAFYNSGLGASPGTTFTTNFHGAEITAGRTLSISPGGGSGTLLNVGTGTHEGDDARLYTTLTNGGNLVVGNVDFPVSTTIINIGQGVTANSSDHRATLDLRGLNTFTAGVGQLLLGDSPSGSYIKRQGTLYLARTNLIRASSTDAAGSIRIAYTPTSQTRGSELHLGQTNAIFTDYLRLGNRSNGGLLKFQPGLNNPTVYLRANNPALLGRMSQFNVSDCKDQTGNNSASASVDTTGGTIDCMVSTMVIGYCANSASASAPSTGSFTMDAGTVDATALYVAFANRNNVSPVFGTLNLNGTATMLASLLTIGRDAGAAACVPLGIVNISSNAKLTVTGNVIEGNATGGNGSSTINMTNGFLSVAGTMQVDNLNLTNANLTLTIGPAITFANPACIVTTLVVASNSVAPVKLSVAGSGFALGQYPLIKYTGVIGGDGYPAITLGTLPTRAQGYLSNNTANLSVDVVITNFTPVKWNGNVNSNWDITITSNWIDTATSTATTYNESVSPPTLPSLFDDTATGTKAVYLTTNLTPTSVSVANSTAPYIFFGDGRLTGASGILKSGSGTLVLTNAGLNDFTGGVYINGGTVQLGLAADRLPTNATVTLANVSGALLDLGGQDQTLSTLSGGGPLGGNVNLGANTLTVKNGSTYSGTISGGGGVLRKTTSGTLTLAGANTYSGGTFIEATALTVINTTGSGVGNGPVDIASANTLSVGNGGPGGSISGATFITNNGAVRFNTTDSFTQLVPIEGSGTVFKDNTNTVTVTGPHTYSGRTTITNGALRISHSDALGDLAGDTFLYYVQNSRLELLGNITVAETIDIGAKSNTGDSSASIVNISDTNTLTGTINAPTGSSFWAFRSDGGKLIINGIFNINSTSGIFRSVRLLGAADGEWSSNIPMGGGAQTNNLVKDGTGTWVVSNDHFYIGETRAYGGRLIINGAINSPINKVIVGNVTDSTFVLGSPALLGGSGTFYGPVLVNTNGILSPGNSIGTMTINNTLSTLGTNVFDVNTDTLEHDLITGVTSVTYGGTLVINPSGLGTAVTNGASVQLFNAASYSGAFAAIVPATPGPGLSWDTSQLTVSGTLGVTSGPNTTPTNLVFAVTGGGTTLDISWPSTHIGWRLQAQTNSLNVGISNNWFTVSGSTTTNHVVMPIDPVKGAVFYRMIYP